MDVHYPFNEVPLAAFEDAGFTFATRDRTRTPTEGLDAWPPLALPQVRGFSPRTCVHPDDVLTISGWGLTGEAFGADGESLLVELDTVRDVHELAGDEAPRLVPGVVVSLDLQRLTPDLDGGSERLAQFANSSLELFTRSQFAWIRTVTRSWEGRFTHPLTRQEHRERLAAEFLAHVTAIDGPSAYWEQQGYFLEDLGIASMTVFDSVAGRGILPTR